jgi:hypothetical protein
LSEQKQNNRSWNQCLKKENFIYLKVRKFTAMKLLILSALSLLSFRTFAQLKVEKSPFPTNRIEFSLKNNNKDISKKFFEGNLRQEQTKIIALPQDHMPCVIPDTKSIAAIPNAWSNVTIPYRPDFHPIPNPALPPVSFSFSITDHWKPTPVK